jgi:integrase
VKVEGKEDHNKLYHRDFKSLLKRAELWSEEKEQRFSFHSLRHTCATLLLSRNVNPKIVQEMLGHATITQTMDTYSHELPGMGDVAASALEKALS